MWVITIQNPLTTGAGLLGNITSFLVTLAPLTTFYRIYKKKSTESFDSLPYVVALFSAMMWLYYALISADTLLMTINAATCFIESTYLVIYLLYAPTKAKIFTLKSIFLLNVGIFGSLVAFIGLFVNGRKRSDIAGWICASFAVSVFAAPLNIIRLVIKTKSVKYMPFLLSFFLTLSAVAWFSYGMLLGDLHIALPNVLGFLFGITQIVVYLVYMNEKVDETKAQDTNLQVSNTPMPSATSSSDKTTASEIRSCSARPPEICECSVTAEP